MESTDPRPPLPLRHQVDLESISEQTNIGEPAIDTRALQELQKVIASIDIPSCPTIVAQAMTESQKDEPDLRKLTDLLATDPGMSAAVLKLANSALYRSGNPIFGVRQAVGRLGSKIVVCVVLAEALRSMAAGLPAAWLNTFWQRSTRLAISAAAIAAIVRRRFGIAPDAAYTYALFQDAAIPVMMKRFKAYEQVLEAANTHGLALFDAENAQFSCSHPIVGSLLVRNWGLPAVFEQAIRFHHEPGVYELSKLTLPDDAMSLIALTQVAEFLAVDVLGARDTQVNVDLFEQALDHLDVSDDELDDLRQRVAVALEVP